MRLVPLALAALLLAPLPTTAIAEDKIAPIGTPDDLENLQIIINALNEGFVPEDFNNSSQEIITLKKDGKKYYGSRLHFGGFHLENYPHNPAARLPTTIGGDACFHADPIKYRGISKDASKTLNFPTGCVSFYGERHCFALAYFQCEERSAKEQHRLRRKSERYQSTIRKFERR